MSSGSLPDIEDYVRSTARFVALPLDDEQVHRVAIHLQRTRLLADSLAAVPLAPDLEPAEIYCPAPFPSMAPSDGT